MRKIERTTAFKRDFKREMRGQYGPTQQMKRSPRTMSLRETKARLSEAVSASQGTYVLVTRHGKPTAIIVGVDGVALFDVAKRFALISGRAK